MPPEAAAPGDGPAVGGRKPGEAGAVAASTGKPPAGVAGDIPALPGRPEAEEAPEGPPGLPPPALAQTPRKDASRIQPAPTTPAGDASRTLTPGVWERLFSGIIAPAPARTEAAKQAPVLVPVLVAGNPSPKAVAFLSAEGSELDAPRDVAEPRSAASFRAAPSPPKSPALPGTRLPLPALEPAPIEAARREGMTEAGLPGLAATLPANPGTIHAPLFPTTVPLPVPQLAAQIGAALSQSADGSTELELSPEELGKVRVKLKPDAVNPDRLVVMITFERPETLELFRRHAGELTDAFRSAGYAGADIGFGQQGGGQPGPDRRETTPGRGPDAMLRPDLSPNAPPRQDGAASLDLRL